LLISSIGLQAASCLRRTSLTCIDVHAIPDLVRGTVTALCPQLRLSFKADPAARPRFANQLLSLSLDLAALDDLPLELPGLELERVRVRRGALLDRVSFCLEQSRSGGLAGATSVHVQSS
jgi:hypothetical protein